MKCDWSHTIGRCLCQMLAAAAGIERPVGEDDVEPWLDLDFYGEVRSNLGGYIV